MKSGKGVNKNYIKRILPSRDDMVKIYKLIKNKTYTIDSLYFKVMSENISYAMLMTAIEAFLECSLCEYDASHSKVTGLVSDKKFDIMNTKVITKLKGE